MPVPRGASRNPMRQISDGSTEIAQWIIRQPAFEQSLWRPPPAFYQRRRRRYGRLRLFRRPVGADVRCHLLEPWNKGSFVLQRVASLLGQHRVAARVWPLQLSEVVGRLAFEPGMCGRGGYCNVPTIFRGDVLLFSRKQYPSEVGSHAAWQRHCMLATPKPLVRAR